MGGGGFMQHASSTNRKDRAHREARREKFKGNYSEDTILKEGEPEKIEFPKLPEEQVEIERGKIKERYQSRRFREKLKWSLLLVLTLVAIALLYHVTDGFEYWDAVLPY